MNVPKWLPQAVVVAFVGALVAGLFGWGGSISARVNAGEKEQAVARIQMDNVKDDIKDIKQDTREIKALLIKRGR